MHLHESCMFGVMSRNDPTDSTVNAWARLIRAQTKVLDAVEADLKAAGFPPLAWYDVLLELRRADGAGMRPMELQAQLLLAQHNVSRLIDRLDAKNLVRKKRAADDGRGQIVEMTEAGRDLLRRMWPVYRRAIQRHMGSKLDASETDRLGALLGKLLEHGP
jgi:DNA-binding MarR family transcriptional regulator